MRFLRGLHPYSTLGLLLGAVIIANASFTACGVGGVFGRATYAQWHLWNDFWFNPDGTTRRIYTEPADERLAEIGERIFSLAEGKGFTFRRPDVSQTTTEYVELVPLAHDAHYGDPIYGVTLSGPNRIIINTGYMVRMTDEELEVLVAHELGHAVDAQSERLDDERLQEWRLLPSQVFADRFAAELLGFERVRTFNGHWVGGRRFPGGED